MSQHQYCWFFFFCLRLQCGSARHFLDSHSLPFWWSATVSAHNEMCQGGTLCWLLIASLCTGVGGWESTQGSGQGSSHPETAGSPQNASWREVPKAQERGSHWSQQPCWNHYVSAQKCQSHEQGFHIPPGILKTGCLPWNSEILHFLFYKNFPVLKKSTNIILVFFYHSSSKCREGGQRKLFLFAERWENTINDENDDREGSVFWETFSESWRPPTHTVPKGQWRWGWGISSVPLVSQAVVKASALLC